MTAEGAEAGERAGRTDPMAGGAGRPRPRTGDGGDLVIRAARESDAGEVSVLLGQLGYPTDVAETRRRLGLLDVGGRERAGDADDVFVAARFGGGDDVSSAAGARDRHLVLVAERAGRVVGWIQLSTVLALESGAFGEIRGLVVHEEERGRGVGSALVGAGERWAGRLGLLEVRVRSNVVRERTHAFYERLGYARLKSQVVFKRRLP